MIDEEVVRIHHLKEYQTGTLTLANILHPVNFESWGSSTSCVFPINDRYAFNATVSDLFFFSSIAKVFKYRTIEHPMIVNELTRVRIDFPDRGISDSAVVQKLARNKSVPPTMSSFLQVTQRLKPTVEIRCCCLYRQTAAIKGAAPRVTTAVFR